MPERIQRKRTKGWRMPENTVYVGRPTKWGNPFTVSCPASFGYKQKIVQQYEASMSIMLKQDARVELRGKNLACFCPLDQPCHADVLLKIANK